VVEQRYQAVLAVINDGLGVKQAAEKAGVSRQTLHAWLALYEAGAGGFGGSLAPARELPASDQMPAQVAGLVLELRRARPY
jgi:transposase-like protein